MKLRIFCDFDGTIALNDVGDQLFIRFGDEAHWWELVELWRQKKIDGPELWRRQSRTTRITPAQMEAFTASQAIDPSFPSFVDFCRECNYPVYVLSDGMDAYIERILKANGIAGVTVRANHLEMDAAGRLTVSFPYFEESCGQCANCKGTHIRKETGTDEKSVYVGDGYSDLCAIGAADILFAKDELAEHCREQRIGFTAYRTFADVQGEIKQIVQRG